MGIRRRPDGTWEFDSVEEALAFELRAGHAPAPKAAQSVRPYPPKAAASKSPPKTASGLSQDERAIKALTLLAAARAGLTVQDMIEPLGLDEAGRGFSGVAQAIRHRISAVANGTPVNKLFWPVRKARQPARWFVRAEKLRELGLVNGEA
jgi:hypothetical protein